ncbi:MAG: 2OG-Fe(II) oxygenase family protein [Ruegeria sp.]
MIEQTKYEKMFGTPFFTFEVTGHEAIDTELLNEGQKLREQGKNASKSNKGGWHSTGNLFDQDAPCFSYLSVAAKSAVYDAMKRIGAADPDSFSLKLFAWMNMNPTGAYNAPHTHPGAHWSGVYYVSQPEVEDKNAGLIEFIDPRGDLPNWRMLKARSFRQKRSFKPLPGELILFPSYLLHWVHPNTSQEDRVSIAFNATFSQKKKR